MFACVRTCMRACVCVHVFRALKGQQPCHLAAERNRVNCLKFLLKSGGAELAARDKSGRTLLHIVSTKSHFTWIEQETLTFAEKFDVNV